MNDNVLKIEKVRYLNILKIVLSLFMTIGCNLTVGDFWPENILPYVFLILIGFTLFYTDWEKLFVWIRQDKRKILFLSIAVFLLQCVLRRPDRVDGITALIKICVKILICGLTISIILLLCVFRLYREKKMPALSFCVLSAASAAYFYLVRGMDEFDIYPIVLILLLYLAREEEKTDKRAWKIRMAGAGIFALCESLGYMALFCWRFQVSLAQWFCIAAIGILIWWFVFYYVLTALMTLLDWNLDRCQTKGKKLPKKSILAIFAVMICVRVLFWMNWFPGILSKDTYVQIQQAIGEIGYSNHHSWLHTMLIKAFLSGGVYQHRVALMSFTNLVISSIILLWIICYYYERISVRVWIPAVVIYMLDPLHCIYSVSIRKDPFFSYILLVLCFVLMVMEEQNHVEGKPRKYMWPICIIVTFLFCFARTNGLYAWFLMLPFLLWHYRKQLKCWLVSVIICLSLIVVYKGVVLPGFHVTEPDIVEALSIPLQQIAYTIQNEGVFSEYDKEIIGNIVDMDAMGERYDWHISDPVKNLIRQAGNQEYITENKGDFIKMYLSVGWKNPVDYIAAFLNQSRGYWHQKASNYRYYRDGVHRFAGALGISRQPLLPAGTSAKIDGLMDGYCDIWNTFWSLALNTYVVFVLILYCLIKRKSCFYFMPLIGILATLVIATPVNDEFRYAYGIYLTLPLLLMQTSAAASQDEEKDFGKSEA